tara:strand:- start:4088 stop:4441 length:354 start_codon:yes stop_codon:yes gene_type:complete
MTYPAPDHTPHDDWFHDSISNQSVPTYKDKDGNDIVNIDPPAVEVHKDEEEITMHEKMYRIATARYNPFAIGGSEECHSDIECPTGGSEKVWKHPHDSMPIATYHDWEDTAPSEYEP